ncbi:MAG: hypothetical protein M3299_13630 [Thermoproteota archaeon]|nr:hypothetical protein [Thermoproteota archaeon]
MWLLKTPYVWQKGGGGGGSSSSAYRLIVLPKSKIKTAQISSNNQYRISYRYFYSVNPIARWLWFIILEGDKRYLVGNAHSLRITYIFVITIRRGIKQ